jgi:hypothetical protein
VLGLVADDIEKHGGDTSKGARDARENRSEANKQAAADKAEATRLKNLALYGQAPPNPAERKVGQLYSSPDGRVLKQYLGLDPKTKEPKWSKSVPPPMSADQRQKAMSVVNEPADVLED